MDVPVNGQQHTTFSLSVVLNVIEVINSVSLTLTFWITIQRQRQEQKETQQNETQWTYGQWMQLKSR